MEKRIKNRIIKSDAVIILLYVLKFYLAAFSISAFSIMVFSRALMMDVLT